MSDPIINPPEVIKSLKARQAATNRKLKAKIKPTPYWKGLKSLDSTAFNAQAELAFIEIVRVMIEVRDGNGVAIGAVYQEAAYRLDISPETAKRYLFKHSAETAEFLVFSKLVMLNPHYQEESLEDEEE